ncbi:MAG TPA: biotin--[acetyl-CoA-carboxylase] ligase [Gemmatimonadales bacterium]|nr:biotin--[acetyl-CoA-carboxylase] ligase [Gemmatimonadales bacterium]
MSGVLVRLEEVVSTQDELHRLAADGAPEGTAVVAKRQSGGRGSRGRAWSSPVGGLWLSVLWRPRPGDDPHLLSLRAGLAVAELLDGVGGLPMVQLKWPNDIIVDGRKAGGLLCEARWHGAELSWVALGLGLNVQNAPPTESRMPAASLAEWRADLDPDALAAPVAEALSRLGGRGTLSADDLAAWRSRDWLLGHRLATPLAGIARGVTARGELRVETAEGQRTVASGDATVVELA